MSGTALTKKKKIKIIQNNVYLEDAKEARDGEKFSISLWPDGNPPANDDECALAVTQINLSIYHLPKIR